LSLESQFQEQSERNKQPPAMSAVVILEAKTQTSFCLISAAISFSPACGRADDGDVSPLQGFLSIFSLQTPANSFKFYFTENSQPKFLANVLSFERTGNFAAEASVRL